MADGSNTGALNSNIQDLLKDDSANRYSFEFENLRSSYAPANSGKDKWCTELDHNRSNARVEDVKTVLLFKSLGSDYLHFVQFRKPDFDCDAQRDHVLSLLEIQISYRRKTLYSPISNRFNTTSTQELSKVWDFL